MHTNMLAHIWTRKYTHRIYVSSSKQYIYIYIPSSKQILTDMLALSTGFGCL